MTGQRIVTVRDMLEVHDCIGRKTVRISTLEHDDIHRLYYTPPKMQMRPNDLLEFAMLGPEDEVWVTDHDLVASLDNVGTIASIVTPMGDRPPICRCGSNLLCDGFAIRCPNEQCWLTIQARICRLAQTQFFAFENIPLDIPEVQAMFGRPLSTGVIVTGDEQFSSPFYPLLQPRFWGISVGNLEHALIDHIQTKRNHISLATFLVEDLFRIFLDSIASPLVGNNDIVRSLNHFYGSMDDLIYRRQYGSVVQNRLVREFIWSLGIESLGIDVINRMVAYEEGVRPADPMLSYVHLLTDPNILIRELNVHPLEARQIHWEMRMRRHEFYDIFMRYSEPEIMEEVIGVLFR